MNNFKKVFSKLLSLKEHRLVNQNEPEQTEAQEVDKAKLEAEKRRQKVMERVRRNRSKRMEKTEETASVLAESKEESNRDIEKHLENLNSDSNSKKLEAFNALTKANMASKLNESDINKLIDFANKEANDETYKNLLTLLYFIDLNSSITAKLVESLKDNEKVFNILIDSCVNNGKSINALIESTSDQKDKIEKIFDKLTLDRNLDMLKRLEAKNLDRILKEKTLNKIDWTTQSVLLNCELNENKKTELLSSLLKNFNNLSEKALAETVSYCIENDKLRELSETLANKKNKKALNKISSAGLLEVLNYMDEHENKGKLDAFIENLNNNKDRLLRYKLDQLGTQMDQLVTLDKKSFKFTTSHRLQNGQRVTAKRSFRRNTEIENKILKAATPNEALLVIYEHLMDVTDPSYAKKIEGYRASNEYIFKQIDELKASPKEKEETVEAPDEGEEEAQAPQKIEIPENLNERLNALKKEGIEITALAVTGKREGEQSLISMNERLDSISDREFKALLKAKNFAIQVLNEDAPNAYYIETRLNKMGAALKKRIPDTKIGAVTFEVEGEKFVWTKNNGKFNGTLIENGKPKPNALQEQIENIKEGKIDSKREVIRFKEKTKTVAREKAPERSSEIRRQKLLEYTERFANKTFQLPEPLGSWSQEEIEANWNKLRNNDNVTNILVGFGIYKEACPRTAAAMISEWSNSEITFADVVKHAKGFPNIALDRKLKKDSDAIFEEFERLNAKRTLTSAEEYRLSIIFNQILEPSIRLMEEMTKLEYDAGKVEKKEQKETPYTREQKEVRKNLTKLFAYTGTPPSSWEEFIAFINGSKNETPVLADMDGNTTYIDQGSAFLRATDEESAYRLFINQKEKGLYGINPEGIAILNRDKVTDEVNRLIKYGFMQIYLQERNIEGKTFKTDEEYQKKLKELQITDMTQGQNFTEEQRRAFQAGYLLDQQLTFEEQYKSNPEILEDTSQAERMLLNKMLKDGIPESSVREAKRLFNFMAGGAITIDKDTNEVTFDGVGVGVGTSLPLDEGFSMVVGMTFSPDMPVNPVLGVGYEIYKDDYVESSAGMDIALTGIGVGASQTAKTDYVDISTLTGVQWNWSSLEPTGGLGLRASWNVEGEIERSRTEMKEKTNYKKLWEDWKYLPKNATDKKFELLKRDKRAWQTLEGQLLAAGYEMDSIPNGIKVKFVEAIESQIDRLAVKEASLPIVSSIGFGVTVAPPYIVPSIGFNLGSATVNVYDRKKASLYAETISMREVDKRMKNAATIEKIKFIEKTADMYMDKYGDFLVLGPSEKIDFSKLRARNMDDYNKELYKSELKLRELRSGKVELQLLNPDYKDFQLHIDPELDELAVIRDGNRIILDGDIGRLNVSRERFTKPYKPNDGRANIMDRIWIGTSSSMAGGRGVEWTVENEGSYFEKMMNEEWRLENGRRHELGQDNIMEIDGYGDTLDSTDYSAYRIESTGFSQETLDQMGSNYEKRAEVIDGVKNDEFGAEIRTNLYAGLDKMFANESFREDFKKVTDQTDAIMRLIYKYGDESGLENLNVREANTAVVHLLNKFYTTLYDEEKLAGKSLERINKGLKKTVEKRINWYKELLKPEFKKALDSIGETELTAEQAVEKLLTDTYGRPDDLPGKGTLFAKLNDPTFNFTELNTSEIPQGAMLFMGTRKYEKDKSVRALSFVPHYVKTEKEANLISEYGLLRISQNRYSLTEGPEINRKMARAILEIASPLPEDDLEFLRSPLAMKIANSSAALLLTSPENYSKITEIYEIPEAIRINGYKEAVKEFRTLVQEIRSAELRGETFSKTVNGVTVEINMNAEIVGGAFTKCSNDSFYLMEKGTIRISRTTEYITSVYNESTDVVDVEPRKVYAELTTALGIRTKESDIPEEEVGKPRREYPGNEGKGRPRADLETEHSGRAIGRKGPSRRGATGSADSNTGTPDAGTSGPSRNR
ncbi:hypothetical protein GF354_00415 [Candidatus Peregrinibacteria bacterium]|nr:hypothetical protein [Candidatus Peregrinibacteria bacterium]